MSRPRRTATGQFAAGHSGNPDGARRRKPKALLRIEDIHRIHLEVAGEIVGKREGKPVTRYEQIVRALAAGKAEQRLPLKDFMDDVRTSTHFFARQEQGRPNQGRKP